MMLELLLRHSLPKHSGTVMLVSGSHKVVESEDALSPIQEVVRSSPFLALS